MVRITIAPDIEFKMDIELEGITDASRDHDVQQHKKTVYSAFMERMKKAFPESDLKIDTFAFGLDKSKEWRKAA